MLSGGVTVGTVPIFGDITAKALKDNVKVYKKWKC